MNRLVGTVSVPRWKAGMRGFHPIQVPYREDRATWEEALVNVLPDHPDAFLMALPEDYDRAVARHGNEPIPVVAPWVNLVVELVYFGRGFPLRGAEMLGRDKRMHVLLDVRARQVLTLLRDDAELRAAVGTVRLLGTPDQAAELVDGRLGP